MYLSAMRYPVFFFLPTAFICICFNYVVLLERTNKDIIYIPAVLIVTILQSPY